MKTFYRFPKFLSKDHCDKLVERAKSTKLFNQDSTISSSGVQKGSYRTSQSFTLLDRKLMKELAQSLNVELNKMERPLLIRYKKGEEFKPHVDFHIEGTENYEQRVRNGQRTLSFVFYLNENYTGGELNFNKLDETIATMQGDLLVIVNQFPDGSMNWESSHASLSISKGTKYILLINYTGTYDLDILESFKKPKKENK